MNPTQSRCLILACGNSLRSDDGLGPWLGAWAQERFASDPTVRVISDHQWTPEYALEIAGAETVLFIDCTLDSQPGQIVLRELQAAPLVPGLVTHHIGGPELLAVTKDLYDASPRRALLLTVGAGSIELAEGFSPAVQNALPEACDLIELTVQQLLS